MSDLRSNWTNLHPDLSTSWVSSCWTTSARLSAQRIWVASSGFLVSRWTTINSKLCLFPSCCCWLSFSLEFLVLFFPCRVLPGSFGTFSLSDSKRAPASWRNIWSIKSIQWCRICDSGAISRRIRIQFHRWNKFEPHHQSNRASRKFWCFRPISCTHLVQDESLC